MVKYFIKDLVKSLLLNPNFRYYRLRRLNALVGFQDLIFYALYAFLKLYIYTGWHINLKGIKKGEGGFWLTKINKGFEG